jgi:2,3-bisphosphoglycerate-independent phosphoglycerate mutase
MSQIKPLLLMILDGWGISADSSYNAITQANTPQWNEWLENYPHSELEACGEAVGLPANQVGNSEVGHMHIGAGRIIWQDFTKINNDIESGVFFENEVLIQLCQSTVETQKTLHVIGLFSPGGVHAHENHLFAFLKLANQHGQPNIAIHLFLDGRDTAPRSALPSIQKLEKLLSAYPFAHIASMTGRFYAMDRDKRWDRVQETYDLLTLGKQTKFATAEEAYLTLSKEYGDEFIPASVIGNQPQTIADGDNIFFYNFRKDRAIQLTESLMLDAFDGFKRQRKPKINVFISMTTYAPHLKTIPAYCETKIINTLGEIFEKNHLKQLRVAETEKFPHVTYFFNGGNTETFKDEARILIPSPKVKTYDLKPEMSALQITDVIVENLNNKQYDVIVANFANPDMVGHCGDFKTTVQAIEFLDTCFKRINQALLKQDAVAIITADHGNAELMFDETTHQQHTAHTLSKVPFLVIGKNWQLTQTHGSLVDIAPTVLEVLGIKIPLEMQGKSLIKRIKHE